MIIYLYGSDAYRRQEKLNWYKEKFKEKHSALTIEYFNLAEPEDLNRLKDFATAQSLFDNFKFGVLENIAEVEAKELENVFKLSLDSKNLTLVVSVEKELPIRQPADKILKEKSVIKEEFKNPTPAEFSNFIKREAEKRKVRLSPAGVAVLAKNYQGNGWGVITELDRLALGGAIDPVLEEQSFFELITKIQRTGTPAAQLPLLEKLMQNNEPAMIFNFLASRAEGKAKTKMADYDVAIKSGKLEYEEALLDAILT